MDLISNKFKYLFEAQTLLGNRVVPEFIKVIGNEDFRPLSTSTIMRSAIFGEAENASLLSGKSLSISNIKGFDDFKRAYQQISNQSVLKEVILQDEIVWDKHLTLIYEKDFIFVEVKLKNCENEKPQFLYWTPIGHTSDEDKLLTALNKVLNRLKSLTHSRPLWLMELGLKDENLFLFQIQPIALSFLGNIFSQNLVQEMLLSRHRFQKSNSLWGMIKTEWRAYHFRKKLSHTNERHPSWIFLNWEYIFHYFKIYCLQKNLKPNQQSFTSFLTVGHEKSWMGEIIRLHFKMANELRLNESTEEMNFVFDQNPSFIFIGKGKYEGLIGRDLVLISELTPLAVYELDPNKIILTKTFSLLSHGILAAIERKMRIVAGIPDEFWEQLKIEENICLDFEARLIKIQ